MIDEQGLKIVEVFGISRLAKWTNVPLTCRTDCCVKELRDDDDLAPNDPAKATLPARATQRTVGAMYRTDSDLCEEY